MPDISISLADLEAGHVPSALTTPVLSDPLGRVWHQSHGDWGATWRRRSGTSVFDAYFVKFHGDSTTWEIVTAVITIEIQADGVSLTMRRTESSDDNDGEYLGGALLPPNLAYGHGYSGTTSSTDIPWLCTILE